MTGYRAPRRSCGLGEGTDGRETPPGAIGDPDKALRCPVQMPTDGAVQVKADGNKGKHDASGCSSSRPEAPYFGHTSPAARIGACENRRGRARSVLPEIDFPGLG